MIGTHHLLHISLLHQSLESRHISFPQVTFRKQFEIETMTVILRTAMHRKVLGTCQQLAILSLTAIFNTLIALCTLQTSYHSQAHLGGEIRILTIGFLATPPSRVTEDIDVRCPKRQALILSDAPVLSGNVVLGTRLITGSRECTFHQRIIPSSSQSHRDRIDCRRTISSDAVQSLVPPVEGRNAQTLNGWRRMLHQLCLLLQRKASQQVFGPRLRREIRVFVRLGKHAEHRCATTNQNKQVFLHIFNIIEFVCTNIQPFPEYSHITEEKNEKHSEKDFAAIE